MKQFFERPRAALMALALLAATPAFAQMPPHGHPGPHGGVPSAVALATIPGLSATQQTQLRRILIQRRNAMEASQNKWRDEFDALHAKARDDHDRIEDQATDQLRKELGEAGFKAYAEWTLAHHGPHGPHGMHGFGPHPSHGPHGHGPHGAGPGEHGEMPPPDMSSGE